MKTSHVSVQSWFFERALKRPEAVALHSPGRVTTYGELAVRARGVTAALLRDSAKPGAVVAIACRDPADFVALLIGTLAAGAVACPFDPDWPVPRAAQLLELAEADIVIGSGAHCAALAAVAPRWRRPRSICVDEWPSDDGSVIRKVGPDSPCYLFFTSGSTGQPKGILGRTVAVTHFVDWEIGAFDLGPDEVVPMLTSFGFDAILRDIFTPLCAGARIVAPAGRDLLVDPDGLAAWLIETRATLWHTTPSLLRAVLRTMADFSRAALKHACTAGEVLLPSDVQAWLDALGGRAELVNFYGPSETTMIKLVHRTTSADAARVRVPIGRPMEGCRAIVLDAAGAPAGVGVVGEIHLRTPYCSLGYFGRQDLTDAVFVPNPLTGVQDDRVYRTGDLGRMTEDGLFEFFGRVDWQLKIRGARVEPTEVEAVLRRHPGVLDLVVTGRELSAGDLQLCAYLVLRDGFTTEAVRAWGAEHMTDAMTPTILVALASIPRNGNGKVEHNMLPDPRLVIAPAQHVPPRTPVEEAIVDILKEVLEIDRVGVTDSFFAIGGHSLLIMQVLSRIEEAFGVTPPLAEIIVTPTAESMAAALEAALAKQVDLDGEMQALIDGDRSTLVDAADAARP